MKQSRPVGASRNDLEMFFESFGKETERCGCVTLPEQKPGAESDLLKDCFVSSNSHVVLMSLFGLLDTDQI